MVQLPATAAIEYVAACCRTRTRTRTKTGTKTKTKTVRGAYARSPQVQCVYTPFRAVCFTLTRIIRVNNSREHSRSSFGLSIHTHANANVHTNNSCELFALSNTIRANSWRINPIFDYFLLTICGTPEISRTCILRELSLNLPPSGTKLPGR